MVLNRGQDDSGRALAQISTAEPYSIESTEGLSEFFVFQAQLSARPPSNFERLRLVDRVLSGAL